ncbi:unnamed protein product [Rotaria sp. Silwood2]|nr:unnamed protein product [Rotaria sp. Silwood2]CAF4405904.1 unnamed protein product [Rotaria sp. Silwood2]
MADPIQKLKNDIALNNAVIFIGRGVSIYTTNGEQRVCDWKGLLKHGLQQCYRSGWMSDEEFVCFDTQFDSDIAKIDDCLLAADQIKAYFQMKRDEINDDLYKTWLRETVGNLSAKRLELIKSIEELECPILTTNYDLLLEDVLGKKPLTWNEYYTNGIDDSLEHFKDYILHIITIEDMSNDALKLFSSSYMKCINEISVKAGRLAKETNIDQLHNDITQSKDIFHLAINPQLASVIATVYNQCDGQLP